MRRLGPLKLDPILSRMEIDRKHEKQIIKNEFFNLGISERIHHLHLY